MHLLIVSSVTSLLQICDMNQLELNALIATVVIMRRRQIQITLQRGFQLIVLSVMKFPEGSGHQQILHMIFSRL